MTNSDSKYDTRVDQGSTKVMAQVTPAWQPFPGFSFLFDNPGNSLMAAQGYDKISVEVDSDPSLALYQQIAQATEEIIQAEDLINRFWFFPLPSKTYHVTVWDGLSAGVSTSINAAAKKEFESCFGNPPDSIIQSWPPMKAQSPIQESFADVVPIRLRYKDLRARRSTVLVVELEPADTESDNALKSLIRQRDALDNQFAKLGKPKNYGYKPHVAVGYFSDGSRGDAAIRQHMDSWIRIFDQKLSDKVIEFDSISLYAFTDMVTYLKP